MPTSRSAKEICREDPSSISCSVATKREARRKRFEQKYGDEKPEAPPSEDKKTEAPKPDPVKERQKYLDALEEEVGS